MAVDATDLVQAYYGKVLQRSEPEIQARIGRIDFFSVTYRLSGLDGLDSHCEDNGQAVVYKAVSPGLNSAFCGQASPAGERKGGCSRSVVTATLC